MPADKAVIGARLRAEREDRHWSRAELARRRQAVADTPLPSVEHLAHMIKEWEAGKHNVSGRYRVLYQVVFGLDEQTLFGGPRDSRSALWHSPTRLVTPDDEERLQLAAGRPARLDRGTIDAVAAILAGQRRLEDAVGPAAVIEPTMAQMRVIVAMCRDAAGPHRSALARAATEWITFAGWLHAALRLDGHALELFARAEDLADDAGYGTGAALATSFRGYVARQQGRPRGVIRAASAALATPGVHPAQETFDTLQAAQGYAALGEHEQARRLLDVAAGLADGAGEPPPPVYWYSRPFFRLNIGLVHAEIGEYRDAVDMLTSGLDGMPADQRSAEWLREYENALADAKNRA